MTARRKELLLLAGAALAFNEAGASGFALLEQNGSGLGNAYAGAAAVAEDPSTICFNAAGLTQLSAPAFAVSAAGIKLNSEFRNRGSQPAAGHALDNEGGDAGGFSVVPALYVAMPFGNSFAAGIGVNAPFGLKTEYDGGWMGRFQALKSEVKTLNVNPSFAVKLNDKVSVGLGADYQRLEAELTNAVNYTAVVASGVQTLVAQGAVPASAAPALIAANSGLQGAARIRGDDTTWGFDLGVLLQPTPRTRLGLAYRSALKYTVEGTASFTAPVTSNATGAAIISQARATTLADGPISLDIELPASARLSWAQDIGERLELLADVAWTQWSSVHELRVLRADGAVLQLTPENWKDTWRYAIGANFVLSDAWKLRAGLAYDETPVPDATRTPRLPDEDRKWVSVGAQWRVTTSASVDAGYAHLFAADAQLNQSADNAAVYGLLLGHQASTVDLLAVQFTMNF